MWPTVIDPIYSFSTKPAKHCEILNWQAFLNERRPRFERLGFSYIFRTYYENKKPDTSSQIVPGTRMLFN